MGVPHFTDTTNLVQQNIIHTPTCSVLCLKQPKHCLREARGTLGTPMDTTWESNHGCYTPHH